MAPRCTGRRTSTWFAARALSSSRRKCRSSSSWWSSRPQWRYAAALSRALAFASGGLTRGRSTMKSTRWCTCSAAALPHRRRTRGPRRAAPGTCSLGADADATPLACQAAHAQPQYAPQYAQPPRGPPAPASAQAQRGNAPPRTAGAPQQPGGRPAGAPGPVRAAPPARTLPGAIVAPRAPPPPPPPSSKAEPATDSEGFAKTASQRKRERKAARDGK
jgi:hypothetical protein